MTKILSTTALAAAYLVGIPAQAEVVGKVRTDWVGNDIVIEAIQDPKVQGVTCHLTYFERSLIDRLQQGNWFEDPSNSAIACQTTGPVAIGNIDLDRAGEEVFTESRSLIFKKLVVNRIYDRQNNALIYLAHTRQVQQGSAKMSISTVPLYNMQATWTKGRP
ncbi:CreA family protein [Microvirga yunnanensis]|uniref:CreA family protein n=1 Tax=Microvirga yunnanensis TaxID=2953740 RepID=UPI0021C77351|nr:MULTISPECIES: CreA family protein [unclassified Microvirga]